MLPPRNPPSRESQIPRYLVVQIQIDMLAIFIWICSEEFELVDLMDFGVVAFSVEYVRYDKIIGLTFEDCYLWNWAGVVADRIQR